MQCHSWSEVAKNNELCNRLVLIVKMTETAGQKDVSVSVDRLTSLKITTVFY